ncbi:MAG: hypothetical protein CL463_04245 [Acidimicrobiaceae bacterium]|nr:hypothetical protein [Acidimicrobiaceae bacterium]
MHTKPKRWDTKGVVKIPGGEIMTDTNQTINEAFKMIDTELSRLQSREVVSAIEASDLLLDLRLLLMQIEPAEDPVTISG